MSPSPSKVNYRQHSIRRNLEIRAAVILTVRKFFERNGYMEVETPIRISAPAPETHIDAQASGSWYLQTSPELYMKRLLSAGYPRIFQICKCFRKNERGRRHLPELTMLEWYTAGHDYTDMMIQCEALITEIAGFVGLDEALPYQGRQIDLSLPAIAWVSS